MKMKSSEQKVVFSKNLASLKAKISHVRNLFYIEISLVYLGF